MVPDLCGENGVCTDTSGNHTCGCLEGYEREGELAALLLLVLVSALLAFGLTRYKGRKEIVTTPTLNNYMSY